MIRNYTIYYSGYLQCTLEMKPSVGGITPAMKYNCILLGLLDVNPDQHNDQRDQGNSHRGNSDPVHHYRFKYRQGFIVNFYISTKYM